MAPDGSVERLASCPVVLPVYGPECDDSFADIGLGCDVAPAETSVATGTSDPVDKWVRELRPGCPLSEPVDQMVTDPSRAPAWSWPENSPNAALAVELEVTLLLVDIDDVVNAPTVAAK